MMVVDLEVLRYSFRCFSSNIHPLTFSWKKADRMCRGDIEIEIHAPTAATARAIDEKTSIDRPEGTVLEIGGGRVREIQ